MLLKSRFGGPPPGEIWSGDDAAVVSLPGVAGDHASLLLTTDAVVAGVHIDLALVSLSDVGWKALTVAISDIAGWAATPAHALVAVGAPPGTGPRRDRGRDRRGPPSSGAARSWAAI